MSAVPVTPQALQDPDAESIKPPSVDRELKSGRILQQACAHCPPDREIRDWRVRQNWLIWIIWFGWLIWIVRFNQINKTNQTNQ
jgi:hypothetical protein